METCFGNGYQTTCFLLTLFTKWIHSTVADEGTVKSTVLSMAADKLNTGENLQKKRVVGDGILRPLFQQFTGDGRPPLLHLSNRQRHLLIHPLHPLPPKQTVMDTKDRQRWASIAWTIWKTQRDMCSYKKQGIKQHYRRLLGINGTRSTQARAIVVI
jgi:hypothetical protein